jgi:hypothetical protein
MDIVYQIEHGRYYISNNEVRVRELGGHEYDDCYEIISMKTFLNIIKRIIMSIR